MLPPDWKITDVLDQVAKIKAPKKVSGNKPPSVPLSEIRSRQRVTWEKAVKENGSTFARKNGHGAVYQWLYWNDRRWLLDINSRYKIPTKSNDSRVDWKHRDKTFVKEMLRLKQSFDDNVHSPRHSRNWYLSQTRYSSTVYKNIEKFPLVSLFLEKNAESTPAYQIRRLTVACKRIAASHLELVRWRILRAAGLSDERLTKEASEALKEILG
jgi:hypothetical protein